MTSSTSTGRRPRPQCLSSQDPLSSSALPPHRLPPRPRRSGLGLSPHQQSAPLRRDVFQEFRGLLRPPNCLHGISQSGTVRTETASHLFRRHRPSQVGTSTARSVKRCDRRVAPLRCRHLLYHCEGSHLVTKQYPGFRMPVSMLFRAEAERGLSDSTCYETTTHKIACGLREPGGN